VADSPSRSLGTPSTLDLDTPVNSASFSEYQSKTSDLNTTLQDSGCLSESSGLSIYDHIIALGNQPTLKSVLKSANLAAFLHHRVKYLPRRYDGNAIFELPALPLPKEGAAGRLEGMDHKNDGHAWMETQTTNLCNRGSQLSFKFVKCLEHLRCLNPNCPHFTRTKNHNDMY
jgi:hypothetical protein